MTGLAPLLLATELHSTTKRGTLTPGNAAMLRQLHFRGGEQQPPQAAAPQAAPANQHVWALPRKPLLESCSVLQSPRNSMEWKAALAEIKREYMNRRFRQCSTRCHEILEHGGENLASAHPAYMVYLRFYAATSLEMQARAMHHTSPCRASLLKRAFDHYSTASELAKQADQDMSRSSFPAATRHKPSESDTSHSTVSTTMSSPTLSLTSMEDAKLSPSTTLKRSRRGPPPRPKKKKVAFCDTLIIEPVREPIIRPDSPTLGFDEWLGRSSPEPVYPEPILKGTTRAVEAATVTHVHVPSSPSLSEPESEEEIDMFFPARSVHRYCTILSSIQRQIASHMTTLDIEIAACQVPTAPALSSNRELRDLDLRARIHRLKASGWNRPRFDVSRYETLRENAMADITA